MAQNLITLRNASSDFNSMLDIHKKIFHAFHFNKFDLSNIATFFAKHGLMASNGRVGLKARERSHNANMSLDSMLMQVKAYGEIFRLLGLWRSESTKEKTKYRVTFLGELILNSEDNYNKNLLEQCWLGIQLPNFVIEDRDCINQTRLLWSYLRAINEINIPLNKQSLIYVCHTLQNDEDENEFNHKIANLRALLNEKKGTLESTIEKIAQSAIPKPITANTLSNSTRLTLAALKQFGWTNTLKNHSYELTEYGQSLVKKYYNYYRPTATEVMAMPFELRKTISIIGLIQLLERANISTINLKDQLEYEKHLYEFSHNKSFSSTNSKEVLFSPYQALSPNELIDIFGETIENHQAIDLPLNNNIDFDQSFCKESFTVRTETLISILDFVNNQNSNIPTSIKILEEFKNLYFEKKIDFDEAISKLNDQYSQSKQNEFYEVVTSLFKVIGFEAQTSRSGQNGSRFDAIIVHPEHSIPIEIKSPTEERFLSVKGIRQALENKIVLLAGKQYSTTTDTSSFLVGYSYPNNRSEVHDLLKYIKSYYNISIAVFSFEELMRLAFKKFLNSQSVEKEIFFYLHGVVLTDYNISKN